MQTSLGEVVHCALQDERMPTTCLPPLAADCNGKLGAQKSKSWQTKPSNYQATPKKIQWWLTSRFLEPLAVAVLHGLLSRRRHGDTYCVSLKMWMSKCGQPSPSFATKVLECIGAKVHHPHQMSLAQFSAYHLRDITYNLDMLVVVRTTKLTVTSKEHIEDETDELGPAAKSAVET